MKTKRFILMLLLALMSATGAWAGVVETDYTIVSTQFTLITPEMPPSYYSCNSSQANMVVKADHAIFLAQVYVRVRNLGNQTGNPQRIKIEGSNNQSDWTPIQENSLDFSGTVVNTVSVSSLDKYQYFRLTFSGPSNYLEFWKLTISEDKFDGAGTSQDPYTLSKVIYLKQFTDLVAAGNNTACVKLTADLDLDGTTFASADNANFNGTIDGDGHVIKNLKGEYGFFKNIGAATIKNLTLENATLSATDENGGVFASHANGTIFQNCTVKGIISASSTNTGGLVGDATGCTFTDCQVTGLSVTGTTVGGLVGDATDCTFTDCQVSGLSVTGTTVGGLVGDATGCTFTDCQVSGLSVTGTTVGGLVGNADGAAFTNCLVLSDFTAVGCTTVGGLAGMATNNATFTKCYTTGKFYVEGTNCGGLVGMASGNTQLTQCYSVTDMDNDEIRPTFVSTETPGHYEPLGLDASKLVDDTGSTLEWCTPTSAKVNGVWNIVVSTNHPTTLKTIKLWNARNTQTNYGRTWKKVKVYGSNTANGSWGEPIGDFDNLSLAINNYGFAGDLEINATKAYTYYKIDVLENKGGTGDDYMQMADMKFVTTAQSQQLPVCGSTDGTCTATLCYHYGSASSPTSTSVETADITSGRLTYLLNNGNITGPYFQRIGTDAYPHFTKTGNNYVYLALDDATYTNACPHRDCTIYPFKAPTCLGIEGNAEYLQCNNNVCKKCILMSNKNVVSSNDKYFTLSNKAYKLQEHQRSNLGVWNFTPSKRKNDVTYYNVMETTIEKSEVFSGDYEISYTTMDDAQTQNLYLFYSSNMQRGTIKVKFYVNGVERTDLRLDYPINTSSEKYDVVAVDGLHKYDQIYVVLSYQHETTNQTQFANMFVGTDKPIPTSHNFQKHEYHYNCIDGGCKEYYECSRCEYIFAKNTPTSDADITTLSALTLAPVGSHNFAQTQTTGNLYRTQCQNELCKLIDSDHYVLKNYHNDTDLPLAYDGNSYIAKEPVSLTDGNAFISSVAFDAPSLIYNRYYPENVWSAWFVPFDVNASYLSANGLTPAYIEGIHNYDDNEDGTIDRTVMEIVKISNGRLLAGTPLLVRAADGYSSQLELSDVTMKANDVLNNIHTETATSMYDFIGTYTGITTAAGDNIYSLSNTGAMVHRTGKILPLRWYCEIEQKPSFIGEETSPALARAIYIKVIGEEDQVTGIRTLYNEADQTLERADGIFDLSGRKLSAPQRGKINIINGKKQFVR